MANLLQWRWALVTAAVAVAAGVWFGGWMKYQSTLGGLTGAFNVLFGLLVGGALVLGTGLVALVAQVRGRPSAAAVSAAIAGGFAIGSIGALALAEGYRAPVESLATVTVRLTAPQGISWTAAGTCLSEADGSRIEFVMAPRVTTLDDQVLWLDLFMGQRAAPDEVSLIVGQPEDSERTPRFAYREYGADGSTILTPELGPERREGRLAFTGLRLRLGPSFDLPGAPSVLDGAVEWSCQRSPAEGGPNPAVVGTLSGELIVGSAPGGTGLLIDFPLTGSCDNAEYGLSFWGGSATASDGRTVAAQLQVDRDNVAVIVNFTPESKESEVRALIPNALPLGGPNWEFIGGLTSPSEGPLKVIGRWSCGP